MEDINDNDKIDEVMLPGFRFHPTDEELVGFYLKRKIQQKPLAIELIKQLDIYKYDPWDLPKFATTGEKEWYFYCPRDRKYRNSVRPNRVTEAGFWKATGTDRPIYSSEGSKCIGLKKSLVFYKGRAAKGIKTDWMMHEFRFPSLSDSVSPKRLLDNTIPANEAWAICRIFKKVNSSKQKALSNSWISPIFDTTNESNITNFEPCTNIHFNSSNLTIEKTNTPLQFGFCNLTIEKTNTPLQFDIPGQSSFASFSPVQFPIYQSTENKPTGNAKHERDAVKSNENSESASKCEIKDASSLLLEMSTSIFGSDKVNFSTCDEFSTMLLPDNNMQGNIGQIVGQNDDQIETMCFGDTFLLSSPDAWKSNLLWDSSSCISELSNSYSTNKCYT